MCGQDNVKPAVPEASDLLRFHLSPVVVTLSQEFPMGMRPHQSPSSPVSTRSLCLPCKRDGPLESVIARDPNGICQQTLQIKKKVLRWRQVQNVPQRLRNIWLQEFRSLTFRGRRDACLGSTPQGFQRVCFCAFLSRIWLCSFFPGIF